MSYEPDFDLPVLHKEEEHDDDWVDMVAVLEAMCDHFHETHASIMQWSWRFFCKKWERLIIWSYEEKQRQEEQNRQMQVAELQAAHRRH